MTAKYSQSVGVVEAKYANFDQTLQLESGGTLNGFQLVYETYGALNAAKSNAILICHALSSDHHAAGSSNTPAEGSLKPSAEGSSIAAAEGSSKPSAEGSSNTAAEGSADAALREKLGWWDMMIGPGKPIDTNKFFVVCSNNLAGCSGSTGPSTINAQTNKPYGTDFPIVTVKDWVDSQALLGDYLGIGHWAAVIGGSLGGMQAMQWSISYPQRIKNALLIATAAKLSAQNIGFNDVARQAIRTDPDFFNGDYYQHNKRPERGLRVARMLGHITYLSDGLMATKFGRFLRKKQKFDYNFNPEFEVESYLRYQGDQFVDKFDANTYLLMTKALDYFDPAGPHDDDLTRALAGAKANFLVLSFNSDWRFSPEKSHEIVRALQNNNLNVSYADIDSPQGHDSFLIELPEYMQVMHAYMGRIAKEIEEQG
ncbi:homoserine O-acetyltransferase [Arenicella sp.]|nr:homoserine O-acetyltransferase [Arenicella sp.]